MKVVAGIYLPDDDNHFEGHLNKGPLIDGRGTYQLNKIEAALECTKGRRVAVDVGAHVGLWSRVLAKHFQYVVAFEPVPEHAKCFRINLSGIPHVELHQIGLGAEPGRAVVQAVADNSGNAHISPREGPIPLSPVKFRPTIVATLDSMAIEGIDLIKIDVEGFEYHVVMGAEQTIRKQKPVLVVEQKPGNAERYGLSRFAAIEQLQAWEAKVLWEKSGDYCLGWPA